ncbi:MAG: hypothetical protein DRJ51_03810 [Thermoprotei archaeon]|nr:MAG: hypothetical protein DRJ51_03810 [Thermoprotei archaeon]
METSEENSDDSCNFLRIVSMVSLDRKSFSKGEFSAEKSVNFKSSLGFNAEHFNVAVKGRDPTPLLSRILPKYLEIAHAKGLRVFVYVNVHWHDVKELDEHPDWFQVDYDGKIIDDVYGKGLMPCVNSPSWRNYSYGIIRKIALLNPDGIFLDGPVFHPRGCYCKYCKELFRKRYGMDPPRKGVIESELHLKFAEFQSDSMADYMKGVYSLVKGINPRILVYLNGETVRPNWATGRDNVKLAEYQDIVGAEGGFEYYNLFETPIFKPGMTAKVLEAQAPNKLRVVFVANKHSPWNREVLPPAELKNRCAQVLANGANYWIGITYKKEEYLHAIKEINSWTTGKEYYFSGTVDASEIALYWSQLSANTYGGEIPTSDFTGRIIRVKRNILKSFQGAYELLLRNQLPFHVVISPEQLDRTKLLILPNVACLTSDEIEGIVDFVGKGGMVVADFETSLYEVLQKRENFGLEEIFGVRYIGGEYYGDYENYMSITGEYYPCYTQVIKVELTTGKPLGYMSYNTGGFYQPIIMSNNPSAVLNKFGKGSAIYLTGNFFETFFNFKFASYIHLFGKLLRTLGFKRSINVRSPATSLEVQLRKKEDITEIHLINFTSDLLRPLLNIVPLRDLVIELKGEFDRAKSLILDKRLVLQHKRDLTVIKLPLLKEYDVIILEH